MIKSLQCSQSLSIVSGSSHRWRLRSDVSIGHGDVSDCLVSEVGLRQRVLDDEISSASLGCGSLLSGLLLPLQVGSLSAAYGSN